jgi:hypothetical protein
VKSGVEEWGKAGGLDDEESGDKGDDDAVSR